MARNYDFLDKMYADSFGKPKATPKKEYSERQFQELTGRYGEARERKRQPPQHQQQTIAPFGISVYNPNNTPMINQEKQFAPQQKEKKEHQKYKTKLSKMHNPKAFKKRPVDDFSGRYSVLQGFFR